MNRGILYCIGLSTLIVVLFALNRGLGDKMMELVIPMLLITSGALIYTRYFNGDITMAVAASWLLEIGQMTQVLIIGEKGLDFR